MTSIGDEEAFTHALYLSPEPSDVRFVLHSKNYESLFMNFAPSG